MPLRFRGYCRCEWAVATAAVVKAMFAPPIDMDAGCPQQPILVNLDKDCGVPEVGQLYLVAIEPAFPN